MKPISRTILAALLLSVTACYADTIFFTALPNTNMNGTYNGFATATVNGIPSQLLICDDYDDTTYMPSSSNLIYNELTLVGPNALQYARFNKLNYDEAAVLVYELAETQSASATTITDYQYALWNLMTPGVSFVPGRASQEQALQTSALALVGNSADAAFLAGSVYAYTRIYTPTAAYASNQEFVEYVAPEPNLAWAAGFLLLLGAVWMKVRRKPQRVKL